MSLAKVWNASSLCEATRLRLRSFTQFLSLKLMAFIHAAVMKFEKFQAARVSTLRCLLGIPHRLPHQPPCKVHPRRSRNAKKMSRWRLQNDGSAFLLRVCRDIWGYMGIYGDIWGYMGIYMGTCGDGLGSTRGVRRIYIYMYLTSINHVIDLDIPVTSLLSRCP